MHGKLVNFPCNRLLVIPTVVKSNLFAFHEWEEGSPVPTWIRKLVLMFQLQSSSEAIASIGMHVGEGCSHLPVSPSLQFNKTGDFQSSILIEVFLCGCCLYVYRCAVKSDYYMWSYL